MTNDGDAEGDKDSIPDIEQAQKDLVAQEGTDINDWMDIWWENESFAITKNSGRKVYGWEKKKMREEGLVTE